MSLKRSTLEICAALINLHHTALPNQEAVIFKIPNYILALKLTKGFEVPMRRLYGFI